MTILSWLSFQLLCPSATRNCDRLQPLIPSVTTSQMLLHQQYIQDYKSGGGHNNKNFLAVAVVTIIRLTRLPTLTFRQVTLLADSARFSSARFCMSVMPCLHDGVISVMSSLRVIGRRSKRLMCSWNTDYDKPIQGGGLTNVN